MTHTPGPWVVLLDNAGGGRNIGIEYKGRFIGIAHTGAVRAPNVLHGREPIEEDEAKANAVLIAAAPDLLDALKGLISSDVPCDLNAGGECIHCGRDNTGFECQPCDDECPGQIARVTITKATATHPPDSERS